MFGLLRFRRANLLMWAGAWWVGIYVLLRFGFTAPIPASVVSIYMGIVSLAILAYVSSSQERREEVSRPLVRFMTEKRYTALLGATVVAIPALAAANVYVQMNVPLQPPLFSRTVHPASPSEITVHDKKIDLDAGENPFRHLETSNPEEFRKHVENGRQVYYRNCVFCHGDNMAGNGMFVHGLDPIPTNFADEGTIPMLRETFLFWRISKGGPGLPEEGGPWDTAMPAWEKFLKEEEMWDAILFLYDFTGQRPRAKEEAREAMTARLTRPRRDVERVARCPDRLVVCRADGIGARAGLPTSGPRRSGSRARSSTSSTVRSATARRGTAKATPPRICTPGPATSRRASSRFGRLPTERSRPIRTSSTSSGAACPTPRCPPGPTSPTRKCRISPTSLRPSPPTSRTPRTSPSPCRSRARRAATKESIELGKKLYEETGCVKCHGTLGRGDGPSAPTLMDDWGHPIRAADLAQSWTFRGGSSREDIFRTMSTGFNGTPMPSFLDALTPEQRWAITDFIVSLSGSSGPGYSNLVVAKHVQDPIDLAKGAANFESAPVGPLSDRRADHGARTRVPSSRDLRDRSGDLRCRVDRPPRSMARHERGEDGEERAVASRAAGGGGGGGRRRRDAAERRSGDPFGDAEVGAGCQPAGSAGPLCRGGSASRRQPSEFSDAVAIQIPSQVPTGARKPYFIFGDAQNSVDLWFFDLARPDPLQFTGRGSADIAPNDTGDLTGVASYDQGEWSVIFKRPLRASLGRRVLARTVHADRLLGLGRVLARAWQQARSHGLVLPLRRARSGPIGRRPDGAGRRSSFSSSSWP